MKLPNGFGSVYKLSGHRRNPWCARKTVGWTFDETKQKAYPIYQFIGYYPNRKDALTALTEYNKDPYDLKANTITFAEVYERWSEGYFQTVKPATKRTVEGLFRSCRDLHDLKMVDIRLDRLQTFIDRSGKNQPTVRKMKVFFDQLWDYCVQHEILSVDRRKMIDYINVNKVGNPNKRNRTPFSRKEIDLLWNLVPGNDRLQIPLVLIYTGIRISELYNLKSEDVHLQERYFMVTESKTQAGIREVPIAEKIVNFFEQRLGSEYVFPNTKGEKMGDKAFRETWWTPMMSDLGMTHLPHDTRHTCVSLLTEAGVDERIIRKIVGHRGSGVTEVTYTHIDLPAKLEAINRI